MVKAIRFDPKKYAVALDRDLSASLVAEQPDPPIPVDGVTIGVASMTENAPHGGEVHNDGDEVLYLVSGRIRVILETEPMEELSIDAGEGLIVPKGVWHRVEILEPSSIAYITPGPNNEFRALDGAF